MLKSRTQYDCIVIGGGPAGAALSMTLASWGRRVAIVEEGRYAARLKYEDMAADALPMVKRLGLTAALRHAAKPSPRRRVLIWGDGSRNTEKLEASDFAMRVDRSLFDADLRGMAQALGVDVYESSRVEGPLPESGSGAIEIVTANGRKRIQSDVIVLATGRQIDTRLLPVSLEQAGPDATMLVADARVCGRRRRFDGLEATLKGFLRWQSAYIPGGWGQISLTTKGLRSDEVAEDVLAEAIERSLLGLTEIELQATRQFDVSTRLVSTKHAIFMIGSAAVALDALLGQSLEQAIADGEAAAVAINTVIGSPSCKSAMLAHEAKRQEERYSSLLSSALGLYLREARYSDQDFWRERHESVQVIFESNDTPALPEWLRVSESVGRYQVFERRGSLLEPSVGYGLPGGPVKSNVHRILVEPLLALVEELHYTDDILTLASKEPSLFMHSRQSLLHALFELCRLGILEGEPSHS